MKNVNICEMGRGKSLQRRLKKRNEQARKESKSGMKEDQGYHGCQGRQSSKKIVAYASGGLRKILKYFQEFSGKKQLWY